MNKIETIVSISTPMGTGAISVIRCSGESVSKIINNFFKKKLSPRNAYYIDFKNKNKVIDDVVAIYYENPKSYTYSNIIGFINLIALFFPAKTQLFPIRNYYLKHNYSK